MTPLDEEWMKVIAGAIGKTEDELLSLLKTWWNENRPLSYMNSQLIKLAEANGKKLVLVDQNNN